jgi:alpha-tubulin suppressor-like RCC1 family protein
MKSPIPLVCCIVALQVVSRAFSLEANLNSAMEVPVTSNGYTATGTVGFTLNFAPSVGTRLTVVKNTGLDFINGTFSNLAHGQFVTLTHNGINYRYVANYYGGTGNDLVLEWANVRPVAWGYNVNGQLGNNSTTNSLIPTPVDTSGALNGRTVIALSSGFSGNLALSSDGIIAGWGANNDGKVGDGTTVNRLTPVFVFQSGALGGKSVVAVEVSGAGSLALCSDGTVFSWGSGQYGLLGNNSTTQTNVPVPVNTSGALSGKKVVAIRAGSSTHRLALCSDGTLVAWGRNDYGQVGDNSTTDRLVPVDVTTSGVLAGKQVIDIFAGERHSLALCSDGTLAAWGRNANGQLGNNSLVDSPVPVAVDRSGVLNELTIVSIAGGAAHSIVLCSNGTIAAWGRNSEGQLGDNTTGGKLVPVAVYSAGELAGKTVIGVGGGGYHSTALCDDGTMVAWGWNSYGQLGNNSTTNSRVPVAVDTSTMAPGERVIYLRNSSAPYHGQALVATPPPADFVIEQPENVSLPNNNARTVLAAVGTPGMTTFKIRNTGTVNLEGLTITIDGTNAADFSITVNPIAPVAPGASTTFIVRFNPSLASNSSATLHIASNGAVNNPFNIGLTGQVLLPTVDSDADGMSDAGEFSLAGPGFDWQVSQPAKVSAFLANGGFYNQLQYTTNRAAGQNDVLHSPNTFGLFTLSQVQGLNVGTPLLTKDQATGKFKLGIGIQKTTDFLDWQPFPFTAPDVTINAQGEVEFLFTVPGNAAFFRLQSQ